MKSTFENGGPRRSSRLQKARPEFHGLDGPDIKSQRIASSSKLSDCSSDNSDHKNAATLLIGKDDRPNSSNECYLSEENHSPMSSEVSDLSELEEEENANNSHSEKMQISHCRSVRRIVTVNSAGLAVQEPSCRKSSSIPLRGERLPTSLVVSPSVPRLFKRNLAVFLFLIILIALYTINEVISGKNISAHERCESGKLNELFPKQSKELWDFVLFGKSTKNLFVLLLVHDHLDDVASCLAQEIAKDVACIRNSGDVVQLDGRGLQRSSLISMKGKLQSSQSHSLVVLHVEDLEPDVADFFHFVLDVEDPWIPGGVYVLTLNVPDIDLPDHKIKTSTAIREFLIKKWSGFIEEDNIDPLISRFGNLEYIVKNDSNPCLS